MNVIKLGGAVCLEPSILDELAATYEAHGTFHVVHGGGPQLDQALADLGPTIRMRGLRVTSPAAARAAQRTLDGIGADLAQALRARDVPAIHMPTTRQLFEATCRPDPGLGRVGQDVTFDAATLQAVVPSGTVAVITPVGWDEGGALNINADEGAAAVATALAAKRLVLATDVQHVHDAEGEAIATMDVRTAKAFLRSRAAKGGIIPKVEAALAVLGHGVSEVRIGSVTCASGEGGTCLTPG